MTQSSKEGTGTGTTPTPTPGKPTLNSTWQRLWSRVEIFLFVAIALSAVGIGLYGLSFLNAIVRARHIPEERPYGLLQTKPKALLADDYYMVSFGLHVFFGAVSIIVGWAQFVDSWRQKQPIGHRWLGRVYVGSVMISAPAVFIVGSHSTGGAIAAAGFSGLALFWIASTASAVTAIRGSPRQLVGHQKAMILSYAMTLSAVSIRIYLGIIIGATGDPALALQIGSWLCWLPHLVPVYILWRRIDRRAAEKLAKVRASVAKTLVEEEEARHENEKGDAHVSESESEFESARG